MSRSGISSPDEFFIYLLEHRTLELNYVYLTFDTSAVAVLRRGGANRALSCNSIFSPFTK